MRFCIVGTGRCGTTLLQRVLNRHPEVFVFPETHWIPKLYEFFGEREVPVDALLEVVRRTRHVDGSPVTEVDVESLGPWFGHNEQLTVREFCDRLGGVYARANGKASWADKTPDYGPYLGLLRHLWPDCRFVHVIRNGADVAVSMAKHPGYQWLAAAGELWWCPVAYNSYFRAVAANRRPLADFARLWSLRLLRIRDELGRLPEGSSLEIRFEDLLVGAEASLRQLASFLELEESTSWLRESVSLVQPDRVRSRASRRVLRKIGDPELQLMRDLGYLERCR